ncbi:MAG: ParB/RepB/Spo0J family partition protein [Myxococcota bacterium]|nr:ParB/RepB/Spo0J family partition protein [Myxococcota bacterium]
MKSNQRTALGRGLSALIPEAAEAPAAEHALGAKVVPIDRVHAAEHQPRTHFDSKKIDELAASISAEGLLQPIVVRSTAQEGYVIIAGERRYRAAHQAGLAEIPVIVRDSTEGKAYELALIENLQRQDLNPLEEAEAYAYLANQYGLNHETIAQRVGRDRVTITNTMRLLKLPEPVRRLVAASTLTAGHGRAILMAPDDRHVELALRCAKEGWSVRQTEQAAKALKTTNPEDTTAPAPSSAHLAVEAQLRSALGAPVKLTQKKGKGRIEIRFHSLDELERLLDLIAGLEGQ